jgi:DNA-binding MarR family transcriptional regulator
MARVHNRAVKGFEISAVQAHVLASLWLDGAATMGEIQNRLALGSSTLTGAIDRMERQGLVTRKAVPGDRRAFWLEPVLWPEKKRAALLEKLQKTEDACFAGLTAAERRELRRLLEKALGSLEQVDHEDE